MALPKNHISQAVSGTPNRLDRHPGKTGINTHEDCDKRKFLGEPELAVFSRVGGVQTSLQHGPKLPDRESV